MVTLKDFLTLLTFLNTKMVTYIVKYFLWSLLGNETLISTLKILHWKWSLHNQESETDNRVFLSEAFKIFFVNMNKITIVPNDSTY